MFGMRTGVGHSDISIIFAVTLVWFLSAFQVRSSVAGEVISPQPLSNAYCNITTYVATNIAGHARATLLRNGKPVIYLNAVQSKDAAYSRFLLAHECCHHTRGHLKRLQVLRNQGALLMLSKTNRSLELDADCCAATMLHLKGDGTAIEAARRVMTAYGVRPTGQRYPAGSLRASIIGQCGKSN